MSYYDSPYTGKEVDQAIEIIQTMKQWICVWGGPCGESPTNCGVAFADMTPNPDTGDRTGPYKILSKSNNEPLEKVTHSFHKGGPGPFVSYIDVYAEGNHASGTSGGWIAPYENVELSSCDVSNGRIHITWSKEDPRDYWLPPEEKKQIEAEDKVVRGTHFIHEVWRYQNYYKSMNTTLCK